MLLSCARHELSCAYTENFIKRSCFVTKFSGWLRHCLVAVLWSLLIADVPDWLATLTIRPPGAKKGRSFSVSATVPKKLTCHGCKTGPVRVAHDTAPLFVRQPPPRMWARLARWKVWHRYPWMQTPRCWQRHRSLDAWPLSTICIKCDDKGYANLNVSNK